MVTVVTFVYSHICLLAVPVFLMAHVLLLEHYRGISYWSLNDHVADLMTFFVICSCIFFGVRRVARPEVRYVTATSDWFLLVLVLLPFLTGFLAFISSGHIRP